MTRGLRRLERRSRSWGVGLAIGLLACTSDTAQEPAAGVVQERGDFDSIVQAAVTLDSRIWCMHEDARGDLWFGSNGAGLFRYDGERLEQHTTADGLAADTVRGIHDDGHGGLLVSTTAGVSRFDAGRWVDVEVVEHAESDGWRLEPGDVWLVVSPGEGGPCRFDGERLHRLELTESPALAAHRARFPGAGFAPDGVYSVFEDRRGHLWFGTASVGLCRYDGTGLAWLHEDRLTTTPAGGAFGIRSIFEDRAGDFWIGNTRQRFQIEAQSKLRDGFERLAYAKRTGLPDASTDASPNFEYYHSMAEDAGGHLWMACGDSGVWKFDGDAVTRLPIPGSDGAAYALCLLVGRDGELWLTTLNDGVFRLQGDDFQPFDPRAESDVRRETAGS